MANEANTSSFTALMSACEQGMFDNSEFLLDNGADINSTDAVSKIQVQRNG
jgi:ankyrin repeat protein